MTLVIAFVTESFQKSRKESQSRVVIIDALRDQTRDKMRGVVQAIKGIHKDVSIDAESKDILDRFTFLLSMENGFLWDDALLLTKVMVHLPALVLPCLDTQKSLQNEERELVFLHYI